MLNLIHPTAAAFDLFAEPGDLLRGVDGLHGLCPEATGRCGTGVCKASPQSPTLSWLTSPAGVAVPLAPLLSEDEDDDAEDDDDEEDDAEDDDEEEDDDELFDDDDDDDEDEEDDEEDEEDDDDDEEDDDFYDDDE